MIYLSWKGIESKWNNLKDLEKSSYSPVHFSFSGIHLFAVNGLFAVHFLRHVRIMDYLRVSAGNVFLPPLLQFILSPRFDELHLPRILIYPTDLFFFACSGCPIEFYIFLPFFPSPISITSIPRKLQVRGFLNSFRITFFFFFFERTQDKTYPVKNILRLNIYIKV